MLESEAQRIEEEVSDEPCVFDREDIGHGDWWCDECGAENSDEDSECQFCDTKEEKDACDECGGSGKVIYDPVGEGPIPCKTCNGRGF